MIAMTYRVKQHRVILEQIILNFGEEYVNKGEILRRKLAEKVFGNKKETEKLNSIFHQKILKLLVEEILRIKDEVIFVELQVLNKPFVHLIEEIWLIKTSVNNAVKRVRDRDGRTEKEVMDIINTQNMQNEQFKCKSRIINNDSTVKELYLQIERLLNLI